MVIFLDTNILEELPETLESGELSSLIAEAKEVLVKVCLPDIVAREWIWLYPYPLSRQKTVLSKVDSSPCIKAVGTEGARRATGVPTAAPYTSAGVR